MAAANIQARLAAAAAGVSPAAAAAAAYFGNPAAAAYAAAQQAAAVAAAAGKSGPHHPGSALAEFASRHPLYWPGVQTMLQNPVAWRERIMAACSTNSSAG